MSFSNPKTIAAADWDLMRSLFEQCLELPNPSREPFLKKRLPDREDLVKDVLALLDAEQHAKEVGSTFFSTSPSAPAVNLAPGTRIGQYEVLEKIGEGGMAVVYRGRRRGANGFTKDVALKQILPARALSSKVSRMFEEEAKLCSAINHPNIVQIHDFVQSDNSFFIVMEFLNGHSVNKIFEMARERRIAIPPQFSLFVIKEACSGLRYAHILKDPETGQPLRIIHRDISPMNIMVTSEGRAKLIDFGITKFREEASITHTGDIVGNVPYMSPEQASGEPLGQRSDLYSLGVVLYELLAGQRLYRRGNLFEILRSVSRGDLPLRALESLETYEEITEILRRCLTKNPGGRYASAAELYLDLSHCIDTYWPETSEAQIAFWMRRLFDLNSGRFALPAARPQKKMEKARNLKSLVGGAIFIVLLVAIIARFPRLNSKAVIPPPTPSFVTPPNIHQGASLPQGKQCIAHVESNPSGAIVSLQGNRIGKTPLAITLECKRVFHVRLDLPGYSSFDEEISVVGAASRLSHRFLDKSGGQR